MNDTGPAVPPTGGEAAAPAGLRDQDAGSLARRLLRTVGSGALATLTPDGEPYASLVSVASLPDGSPVMPLSTLAVHTRHLMADPRCSLLLDGTGAGDPLARPRLTVSARAVAASDEDRAGWRGRFLRRHPEAELYIDFGDFSLWRLDLRGGRLVGGFGRIASLAASDLVTDLAGAADLLAGADRAVDHMNADHADALRLYATALCGAPDGDWRMVGLDPEGLDLAWRDAALRLAFPERIVEPRALRAQLVRWAGEARAQAAGAG